MSLLIWRQRCLLGLKVRGVYAECLMKIEKIHLKNFKVFQNVTIEDLPEFCVIVGANGSGKTTFFDVFGFLKDCLTFSVGRALMQRGGFKEVVSRGHAEENIELEIEYRLAITGKERLVTYLVEIGMDDNRPVVMREVLRYKRGEQGSPFHVLDFQKGIGSAISNEEDFDKTEEILKREQQNLGSPDTLAIKGLGQFQKFKAANTLRQMIESWHVSDFHITASRGAKDAAIGEYDHLSASGDNLQLVARDLHDNHPDIYQNVLGAMRAAVPGVHDIKTESTVDGRLVLQFGNGVFKDPFLDRFVSDGTLKMFAYLVLLHDPNPHPFLCVEEPENQLYPRLLTVLAEEFRSYALRGGQVMVSTHSPDFLNATELEEVFWLEKNENGFSSICRAKDDEQIATYMADGDKMGRLWKQGFFGKADPR